MRTNANRSNATQNDNRQSFFWIRTEVFEQGTLQVQFPSTYSAASILKISGEVSDASKIAFSEWITISKKCLSLSADVATVLFTTFESISSSDCAAVLQNTRDELCAKENGILEAFQLRRIVPLRPFQIFLMIQLYHRNSHVAARQDTWPSEAPSAPPTLQPMLSPTRAMALSARVTDQDDQLQFVKRHLHEMLELVAGGGPRITLGQFQDLALLLHEGESPTKEGQLGSTIPGWQRTPGRDPSAPPPPLEIAALQMMLQQRLGPHPTLYPPVDLPTHRTAAPALWAQDVRAHVTSVSGVTKSLFVRTGENMNPQLKLVRIFCNHQANIYLIMPLQHVAIFGCTSCTIVLGTVAKMVTIEHCEKVRIVCAARALHVSHCSDTRLYVCLNTKPVIGVGNKAIELAPYNIHYPTLEFHLQVSGVNPRLNYWDQPLALTSEKAATPLPAQRFFSLAIPFALPGDTVGNPCPLPAEYTQELQRKTAVANQSIEKMRNMHDPTGEARRLIHSHFREWLVNSGNLRHVLDLLHFDERESAV